ncbi:MAG TPA: dihydroorotase [Syntrophorhabdaceae bacterium]|nr:dihydroorotase [Syntrophorhabdaceae bacterium]HPP06695.1 dihydroorotase [Syntrophorhabdaceae bacterium]
MKILIKKGRVIDPKNNIDKTLDVYINGNVIEKIDKNIRPKSHEDFVIDATDHIVAPGFIDVHVHLREPGYEYKETIKTGTMAAAKGGFTSVVCMANTDPVNDNRSVTEFILKKARLEGSCRVFPCGAITKGLKGEELSEIGDMFKAGIVAISDDGKSVKHSGVFRKALEYSKIFGIPVISHCEDSDLSQGFINEGIASLLSGLDTVPTIAEEIIVQRDIMIARYVNASIHLTHISSAGSVDIIAREKRQYKNITCDTCPHYFTLTEESTLNFDTNTKVNPPLRSKKDVEAIKEGLKNNIIDIIATDHAPHDLSSKDVEFNLASSGISGLETALGLSLALVHEGVLTLAELIKKFTVNPAMLLKLPYGELKEGKAADVIVFNPYLEWIVDKNTFLSKGKNTPFDGYRLKGKNLLTIVDGEIVYRDGLI